MSKKEYTSPTLEVVGFRITEVLAFSPPIPTDPEIPTTGGFEGFDD